MTSESTHKKHIVVVTDAWHPQINGVVTSLEETSKRLKERGYEVTMIHPGLFHTVPVPNYPDIHFSVDIHRMQSLLSEANPDYIHIVTEGPLGLAARVYCQTTQRAFTSSFHTNFQQYLAMRKIPVLPKIGYRYLRWFHSASSVTMVTTMAMKEELEHNKFKNVVISPLGVDTDMFAPRPDARKGYLKHPIFGYLGRVAKEKSVEEFLKLSLPGTKLVIGDGPQREALEKKYGKSARFVGFQTGDALVDWLTQCDVLVMPSRTETFGLVIIEALACGIPVAAHNAMGPREIITQGIDGYMSEDLAEAAQKCLSLSSTHCREKALHFSWEAATDAFTKNLVLVKNHPSQE